MSTNRREFLGVMATVGAGAMVPWRLGHAATAVGSGSATAPLMAPTPLLQKFATRLLAKDIKPPSITPAAGSTITLPIAASSHVFHPVLPPTPTWAYGGATVLGPTIEATVDVPFSIWWRNDLPGAHLLASAIDPMVHGADPAVYPPVRIVTHLHGGHVPHTVDGGPEAWYVNPLTVPNAPDGNPYPPNPKSHGDTYFYPNHQLRPGTLWYHDHALGITRLNVYTGLAGFYLMRDAAEKALGLPSGDYEIPLAIQDRMFNTDGTLYYPPPPHVPEFFGDTMVVNGQIWPKIVVEARKYRFRLLNGCNARFLRMRLVVADQFGVVQGSIAPAVPFQQIGTEGGLMNATAVMPELTMAPGERCDVVVDFAAAFGNLKKPKYLLLHNDAGTPFSNTASRMGAIPEVMLFEVRPAPAPDTSVLPPVVTTRVVPLNPLTATRTRNVTLEEVVDANGNLMALLNGAQFMDPATETPALGDTEVWNIINLTPDTHPIHTHQTMFQVLGRQTFNVAAYNRAYLAQNLPVSAPRPDPTPFLTGKPATAAANELGWKDTVRANPGEVTRIIMKFENYSGEYVWHCHILEYEDHEMMRPLTILPALAAAG